MKHRIHLLIETIQCPRVIRDVDELMQLKDQIIQDDLLVNRLRTKA